jgi:hypothetical protein
MSQEFYELERNFDRFQPEGAGKLGDGYLETKFNNWEEMDAAFFAAIKLDLYGNEGIVHREKQSDNLLRVTKAQMPADLKFVGFNDLFTRTDYPYLPGIESWPIMSRKMLNILLSLGNFSHQIIPVIFKRISNLLSVSKERENLLLAHGHDFIILQLLNYSDLLDRDNSDYTIEHETNLIGEPVEITNINKVVLKKPVGGFPPIFRIREKKVRLYVSAEAKEALEKAGVQGLDFSSWNIESS